MGVLPKGVEGNNFTFTYQTRNDDNMIDDLGHSICKVAEKSPDGMLIFFPSYFLMDKCYNNWDSSGILDKLEKYKSVYKEPKRSSQFKSVRRNFESDIDIVREFCWALVKPFFVLRSIEIIQNFS